MAKKLVTSYTFTPGGPGVGTVVVSGTYTLEQFLLITNVTKNVVIYEFDSSSQGGSISTGGGNTTLTLIYDTSTMSAGDRLQIFLDDGIAPQTSLASIDSKVPSNLTVSSSKLLVDGSGVTQPVSGSVTVSGTVTATGPLTDTQLRATAVPVSAASLPLPTGAATQTTLASIDTDLGAQADAVASSDTGTFSLIALIKRGLQNWTTLLGRVPALTVTSTRLLVDGSGVTQPVSGTITANAGTNLNTSALALESGGNLASINTKLPTLALGAQAPTAALATVLPNKTIVGAAASTAALNTDLLTGTVNGWYDAAAFSFVQLQWVGGAGITAGAVQVEATNDTTVSAKTLVLQADSINAVGGIGPFAIAASSTSAYWTAVTYRYIRVRVTTAFAGGTVQVIAAFLQQPPIQPVGSSLSQDLKYIASNAVISPGINGGAAGILPVFPVSGSLLIDYSAQNVAAASGSLSTVSNSINSSTITFDVNLTAFTAGSSTGLDLYLQESPDNGTTYYDIWQCETLTAVGRCRIPAIPVNGRRRIRWVNRGGAATTATLTVTSTGNPTALPIQRQFFDRTSGVGSGTAVLNTNSAAYDIAGCKQISVVMQAGTATAVGSFQVQMSMDGTNWYNASAATAIGATTANNTVIPITSGMVGRYLRVTCTAAGTTQVINAIHIYGTN